jgi:hypothetical protein
MNDLIFTTIANAKKQTNLSYIGGINVSQKIIKGRKVNNTITYCVYLAPAKTSGYEVCPNATIECKKGCLATSGRAAIELWSGSNQIHDCRINKTKLFFEQQTFFMNWLIAEITSHYNRAKKLGYEFAVRLNGTSDIDWANVKLNGKNIFEIFPAISFYDYTKNPKKFENKPSNYHLTLSYTGKNWEKCKELLGLGVNVAMIFNIPNHKGLPIIFDGYKVIDGDITDVRVKDETGIIVGLHWKKIADAKLNEEVKNSCFVVQPNDIRITHYIVKE